MRTPYVIWTGVDLHVDSGEINNRPVFARAHSCASSPRPLVDEGMSRDTNPPEDDTIGLDAKFAPHPDPPWPERLWVLVPADGAPEDGLDYRAAPGAGAARTKPPLNPTEEGPRTLPTPDEILTPADVARHLAIPKKTVIFLCAEGRLVGAFKAGRRWRIPGRAVRLMANGEG